MEGYTLLSFLGRSPGTLHTTLCALLERGIRIEKVVVVATRGSAVDEAVEIARLCPCPGGGEPPLARGVELQVVTLGFEDVRGVGDLEEVRRLVSSIADRHTLIDVTAGRRVLALVAAVEGVRRGARIVYALVPYEEQVRAQSSRDACGKTVRVKTELIII